MSQIKQLLLLYQQKKRKKAIATVLGMSKNTVKSFSTEMPLLQGWPFGDHFDV